MPDSRWGRVLLLRDPQGIAESAVQIPPALVPVVARFDGSLSLERITELVSQERGAAFPHDAVVEVERALDAAGLLESPTFRRRLQAVQAEFDAAALRVAEHAGGAYPGSAEELTTYIEEKCMPLPAAPLRRSRGFVRGLCAPHIDPWRGARGYGAAYQNLRDALDPRADTVLVFGTSHAPMREPFALCRKGYDTPLGALPCNEDVIDRLAASARFDAYRDRLNHKKEHSIEFQAVFLRSILGDRPATIVPVLAGLGASQASGETPEASAAVASFLDSIRELAEELGPRLVLVAGVDLAHVGPRFGDPDPADAAAREQLERVDRQSMQLFSERERESFWQQVVADLDTRRVCGLAPMYSLLWTLGEGPPGSLVHYEQTLDADDGSIVSHAAMTFSS